jgi:hypothetical protein
MQRSGVLPCGQSPSHFSVDRTRSAAYARESKETSMSDDGAASHRAHFLLAALIAASAPVAGAAQLAQVTIRSLEGGPPPVAVQFNPTEITISKPVPWQKHKSSKGDGPTLEFTGAEPKTLSVELLFDTYESRTNVHDAWVANLEKLALVDEGKKRPPMCLFTWGTGFPPFKGVIESISVKYTLFLEDGTPVRAVVDLKLAQADTVRVKGAGNEFTPIPCVQDTDCPPGQGCLAGVCAVLTP